MKILASLSKAQLLETEKKLEEQYNDFKNRNITLDMSRGKPSGDQLNLSNGILTAPLENYITEQGIDARNYGILDGISEVKRLFSELLDIPTDNMIIGGNSSLNLIYDAMARLYMFGSLGSVPWGKLDKVKILCPVPGYDRHFAICEEFGFEMVNVPMKSDGPDMEVVESMVKNDPSVKGIMCVPLYSNPDGTCYSEETVTRLACMETAAEDFKIFWDNAYGIHHVFKQVSLYNIFDACRRFHTLDRILYFFSTSKITFPGSGVALVAAGDEYIKEIKQHFGRQTIGYDKINQLRVYNFFKDVDGMLKHMADLAQELRPKFNIVLETLNQEFDDSDMLTWKKPLGGYFVSVNTMTGCAKETVRLAKEAGLSLTNAGATYPYGKDPSDSNIRIAPSYPTCDELEQAMQLFCICVKLASVRKALEYK
ncbi:MAG: aminotransferase class I/II-fold pyridoxal phosphate-dependent enzyme [Firmicutes bacterium]|nr:aminotransferase class I/II-fold pyridoxal phosphate-dependent enzyme [Bacillota bacterium]